MTLSLFEPKNARRAVLACTVLTVLTGVALIWSHSGNAFTRASYDFPFLFRSSVPPELILVLLDEQTKANLGVPAQLTLPRRYHARLLDRLTGEGARLVLFDLLFDTEARDPADDTEFARALKANGRAVLVAEYQEQEQIGTFEQRPVPPISVLRNSAAGWGLARLTYDADYTVRLVDTGAESFPSASWVAASLLPDFIKPPLERMARRWLNPYGAPGSMRVVNFDRALEKGGLPAGFFRNKVVVVGTRPSVREIDTNRDQFGSPWSRVGAGVVSGVEIHAVSLLNLLHRDWLKRLSSGKEILLISFLGFGFAVSLMALRPWPAAWLALGLGAAISLISGFVQLRFNTWWPWLVPVGVQIPLALVASIGWHSAVETLKRLRLRRAFAAYLSPEMADQISESDIDLSLGGKVVDATILFTDIEGFTAICESMEPGPVSHMLTTYFNLTSKPVFDRKGTIIKFIGDAIMAVWGAPIEDPGQAENAVLAAIAITQAARQPIAGHHLRTRVGINSGRALAGNLGSDRRFDYTVIGDATNYASRLEGFNKYFHTEILISDATRSQLSEQVKVRRLGRFLIPGKSEPVCMHEVLGLASSFADADAWLAKFENALACFSAREFDQAEALFRDVIKMRGGSDGPSDFYLAQIADARKTLHAEDSWHGVVKILTK